MLRAVKLPRTPPDHGQGLLALLANPQAAAKAFASPAYLPTVGGRYVHWNKLRFLQPPTGLSHEQWWSLIKLARSAQYRRLPLTDARGKPFEIASPDPLHKQLSELDRDLSGRLDIPEELTNEGTRSRYVVSALIEEAITSSQLEGASTTRKVGADMLRSGRPPRDLSERMIFNNYDVMQFVGSKRDEPLTVDLILEIHRRVTLDTLDDGADAGRLRTTDDIHVRDRGSGTILHTPPLAVDLPKRLQDLCDFANNRNERTPAFYLHPLVRAALVHFCLGHDHPFVDGNGRTARALFYWSALNSGYWLCEYTSISAILRKAPVKYSMAYLYTETDGGDATYFVLYQLGVLRRALTALHDYLREKLEQVQSTQALLKASQEFNHRQLALLSHALRNPLSQYTVASHANSHGVTKATGRADLTALAKLGLFETAYVGTAVLFVVPEDLEARLQAHGRKRLPAGRRGSSKKRPRQA